MVSVFMSGTSYASSSPGQGHRVEILDKVLYSHSASFHVPVEIIMVSGKFNAGGQHCAMDLSILSRESRDSRNTPRGLP